MMREIIGKIARKAREERKMSQRELVKNLGSLAISERTLRRIENGCSDVKVETIRMVLSFFGLEIDDLCMPRDKYEEYLLEYELSKGYSLKESIETSNWKIKEYRSVFCSERHIYDDFPIRDLSEFLIYFPLMDIELLSDSLWRIGGAFLEDPTYVLEQMRSVYWAIPDSDKKVMADNVVRGIRKLRNGDVTDNETAEQEIEQLREDIYEYYNNILNAEKRRKTMERGTCKQGVYVRDLVSGQEGLVVGKVIWMFGCEKLIITPKEYSPNLIDGYQPKRILSEEYLELSGEPSQFEREFPSIKTDKWFGKKCKDKVTGWEGICIACQTTLFNSDSYALERLNEKGNPEREWFDEGRLEIIEEAITTEDVQSSRPDGADIPLSKFSTPLFA